MDNYAVNIALLYSAATIALIVFYLCLRAGRSLKWKAARSGAAGGGLALSGIVLATMVFGAAQGNIGAPAAAVVAYLIMLIGFVMCIAGLGLYLGAVVAMRGRLAKVSVSTIPLLVVCVGVVTAHTALLQERSEFRAARAVFLSETVRGTFAGHQVAIPVAPHYAITHACASRPRSTCHSVFLTATSLNEAAGDGLDIFTLEALQRSDHVLRAAENWCAARDADQDAIWCTDLPSYRLTLRLSEDARMLSETNGWKPVAGTSEAARLACRHHNNGRTCKLLFVVAEGVVAEAAFHGVPETTVIGAEKAVRARAETLWQAILAV